MTPPTPHARHIILLVLSLLIIGVTLTTPAIAEDVTWQPYPADYDVDPFDVALMWSLDEDTNTDANNSDADSSIEFAKNIAKSTDYSYNIPPTHPEQWNDGTITEFDTSNDKSVHPPSIDTTDSTYIKDAYIDIPVLSHGAYFHKTPNAEPTLITPHTGNAYTITDYRVAVPDGTDSSDRRVSYTHQNTEITETEIRVTDGYSTSHPRDEHTSKLPYENIDTGEQALTVEATIESEITKETSVKVTREREDCSTDESGNETCIIEEYTTWETTTTTLTDEHTVTDTKHVEVYNPEMTAKYRELSDGSVTAELNLPPYWTAVTTPNGHTIDSPYDSYTQRNTEWDTQVDSTATGENHEYLSPINPVQTHTFPNTADTTFKQNLTADTQSGYRINVKSSTTHDSPTLPENIDFNVADNRSTYDIPSTVTFTSKYGLSNEETQQFTVHSVSQDSAQTTTATPLNNLNETSLNATITNTDTTNQTVTLQISLTETVSQEPVETTGTNGYIGIENNDARYQTGADGTANVTANYTKNNPTITVMYHPQNTFEDATLAPSEDTVVVRDSGFSYWYVFELVRTVLVLGGLALVFYYPFTLLSRNHFPWPPWK